VLNWGLILWIAAMTYTVLKRDRQLSKVESKLKKLLHEQEERQRETEKASKTGNDSGRTA
jgi:hypothetical protein